MTMCEHDWLRQDGGVRFFVQVALTLEEPNYYPPGGYIPVEVCTKCHLIRIPFKEAKDE